GGDLPGRRPPTDSTTSRQFSCFTYGKTQGNRSRDFSCAGRSPQRGLGSRFLPTSRHLSPESILAEGHLLARVVAQPILPARSSASGTGGGRLTGGRLGHRRE